MKEFKFLIIREETYKKVISIEAKSFTEAREKAEEYSENNDISQESNTLESMHQEVFSSNSI